jgi:hypothetical protein
VILFGAKREKYIRTIIGGICVLFGSHALRDLIFVTDTSLYRHLWPSEASSRTKLRHDFLFLFFFFCFPTRTSGCRVQQLFITTSLRRLNSLGMIKSEGLGTGWKLLFDFGRLHTGHVPCTTSPHSSYAVRRAAVWRWNASVCMRATAYVRAAHHVRLIDDQLIRSNNIVRTEQGNDVETKRKKKCRQKRIVVRQVHSRLDG